MNEVQKAFDSAVFQDHRPWIKTTGIGAAGNEEVVLWVAEDSDLRGVGRYPVCPVCGKDVLKTHCVKTDYTDPTEDADIAGWHFKHSCGAKLLIIND